MYGYEHKTLISLYGGAADAEGRSDEDKICFQYCMIKLIPKLEARRGTSVRDTGA